MGAIGQAPWAAARLRLAKGKDPMQIPESLASFQTAAAALSGPRRRDPKRLLRNWLTLRIFIHPHPMLFPSLDLCRLPGLAVAIYPRP